MSRKTSCRCSFACRKWEHMEFHANLRFVTSFWFLKIMLRFGWKSRNKIPVMATSGLFDEPFPLQKKTSSVPCPRFIFEEWMENQTAPKDEDDQNSWIFKHIKNSFRKNCGPKELRRTRTVLFLEDYFQKKRKFCLFRIMLRMPTSPTHN